MWVSVYYSNQNSYPDWRFGSVTVNGKTNNITYPTGGNPANTLQDTPVKLSLQAEITPSLSAHTANDPTQYAADISHIIVWQSDA